MKILSNLLILIVLMTVGCKTQKIAPKPQPVKSEAVVPETVKSETVAKPAGSSSAASSVKSREEHITAAKGEASDLGSKRFYIILGSFGVYENAQKFKKTLASEGFSPGILINEKGLYRVCAQSYDDESAARSKMGDIRQQYTKYADLWLLIRK
ncbi:MAG: SPOR domain-containing protein [Bacteroidia bacterium]|nr:SPOR domain-containing protein [Bacteroidia bacterium]